jgi:hypothetical protein
MPKKNSKRQMTRLVKVLRRNAALKHSAKRSFPRPASALQPQPQTTERPAEQVQENEGNQE